MYVKSAGTESFQHGGFYQAAGDWRETSDQYTNNQRNKVFSLCDACDNAAVSKTAARGAAQRCGDRRARIGHYTCVICVLAANIEEAFRIDLSV